MSINSVLNTYGQIGVQLLKQALSSVRATGKTERSITYEITDDNKLIIYAREFTQLIEKGIKPSGKNPPPEMIQLLTEYAQARGMADPKKAAWGIAKTILKEGDKTHKRGGRIVYSDVLQTFQKEFKKALIESEKKTIQEEISRKLNALISKDQGTFHEGQYIKE